MLRHLAHWLMKEPALEEEALRASVLGGRQIRVERQTMEAETGPVSVTAPSGEARQLSLVEEKPGLFAGELPARELGLHTLRSGDLVAFASVGPVNPLELSDVFSDPERLRAAAESTGGSVRRIAADSGLITLPRLQSVRGGGRLAGSDWIGIRPSDTAVVRGVSVFPIALGILGLALLLGATLAAWVLEGGLRRRA
jgi:hypothetical protein